MNVKSPFLLPMYVLALALVFVLVFATFSILASAGSEAPAGLVPALGNELRQGATHVFRSLPVAILAACLLTAIKVARIASSRFLSISLPFCTICTLLYFGTWGLTRLPPHSRQSRSITASLLPGVLTPVGDQVVVARRVGDDTVEQVVVAAPEGTAPRLSFYAFGRGGASLSGTELRLYSDSQATGDPVTVVEIPDRAGFSSLFEPVAGAFGRDLAVVADELRAALEVSPLRLLILSSALAAFLTFSGFLVRSSRWPFLNILILGLLWRAMLAAHRFIAIELRPQLSRIVAGEPVADLAPAAVLLACGLACLLVDVAFFRFDLWKSEIEG